MNKNEPAIMDHEYDGIREYDNPTPGWWHLIFMATVLFAGIYIPVYHFSDMTVSIQESWRESQVAEFKRIFGKVGDLQPDEATIVRMMNDETMLAVAQSTFVGNCAVCHGKDGSGINGVNLTDNSYKNVKKLEDVLTTITKGANLGAMPGWEQRLSQNERIIVAAYVAKLRGKNLAGRAAEGEEIPAWPTVADAPAK